MRRAGKSETRIWCQSERRLTQGEMNAVHRQRLRQTGATAGILATSGRLLCRRSGISGRGSECRVVTALVGIDAFFGVQYILSPSRIVFDNGRLEQDHQLAFCK